MVLKQAILFKRGRQWQKSSARRRKKAQDDNQIPCILEPALSSKQFRKNWARLIQKIYEVDLLLYSNCNGTMQVIAFIEDSVVIKKILKHLSLWRVKCKPPRAHGPPTEAVNIYDDSPAPSADDSLIHADYPIDAYIKKSSCRHTDERCPNLLKISAPA